MAINFPSGATNGQQYTTEQGSVYRFDGEKWVVDGAKDTLSSVNSFTASYYVDSASFDSILDRLISVTASYLTSETDSQTLSINGTQLSISNGNTITIPTGSTLPSGVISGSSQLTASYDTRYTLSGSVQPLPSGLISGSSQLTSSLDTRYALSGSVVNGTTPLGTVSGSSQLTSSYDGRYVQTGSFNTLTASFNSFTSSAQAVTTGSNSFNGTQTITGSLVITSGSFIGSQILANTSSLYLTSGSNLYLQNNGVVEITGSIIVSGSTTFKNNLLIGNSVALEGGEIDLVYAATTTLTGSSVAFDVYGDKVRIFEGGGNSRGVSIDLSKAPNGVGGDLLWKTSGLLNTGSFVQMDNIKAGPTRNGAGGSLVGLSVGAVSTTFVADISATYANNTIGGTTATAVTYTTTAANAAFGWGFSQGNHSTYILNDTTNSRVYRITLMVGASFNNNFTSIERLY